MKSASTIRNLWGKSTPKMLYLIRMLLTLTVLASITTATTNPCLATPVQIKANQDYYLTSEAYLAENNNDSELVPDKSTLLATKPEDPRTNLWYRFDVVNQSQQTKWFLNTTNTLIEQVTVYSRHGRNNRATYNGFQKSYPFDLTFAVPVNIPLDETLSIWVNIKAPYISEAPLFTLMPQKRFFAHHFNYTSMILIALGAMLALVVYNAFLYFPTRDSSFIWYAGYQLLCTFAWAVQFKVLLYCFNIGLDQSTLYLPFYIAGAASLMFAITFLRLSNYSKITYCMQALAIALVICGVVGLFLSTELYYRILAFATFVWLAVMLILGVWRFKQGYKPARFYVAGFAIMSTVLIFILGGNLTGASLFDNPLLWTLWAQLVDSLALALALADRINFLRKSRQHADKRATTDRLTGLPNRTAFERDVRAWEAYYKEGIVQEFFLTFIDVDGLKQVNDHNGHNEGDRLLKLVSKWLSQKAGEKNIYRIGGDEFVILSQKQIQWNLTSLHTLLDSQGFPHSDLSIGSSCFSESGNRSTLLKLADERMYAIKKGSR